MEQGGVERGEGEVVGTPPPPSSATDASATATGAPGALSDDKLALALTLNPAGSTAKDLASVLGASKSDVNKALYRMRAAGRAIKSEGGEGAPRWTAAAGRGVAPAAAAPKVEGTAEPTVNRALGAATATETVAPTGSADARAVEGQICALSRARRCVVSEYRGKKMVSLREYYEKDGAWLPGKKGISLWYEQWSVLRSHVASTDAKIAEREAKGARAMTMSSRSSPPIVDSPSERFEAASPSACANFTRRMERGSRGRRVSRSRRNSGRRCARTRTPSSAR